MLEHNFKKKFGQNFISDKNLLEAIANDAEVDNSVCVLEIGAGWGSLTEILDKKAKKVKRKKTLLFNYRKKIDFLERCLDVRNCCVFIIYTHW